MQLQSMKKLLPIVLFLAMVLGSHSLFAQTGNISGTIKTSDGKMAAFVNVGLKGLNKGTSTNEEGWYEIKGVPEGIYTLSTSYVGLEPKELQIKVVAGQTTVLPEVILEETEARLQEVVVQSRRHGNYHVELPSQSLRIQGSLVEAPQSIQVITTEVLKDQQAIDMLETVSRNVSGVQMIEHWGNFARINMRGFKIPAFRNGMNVDLPWGPLAEDMSVVERIEFVKGPAGFMLSAGEPGGLYNVVTKKPNRFQQNEVSLTVGSFNTLRSTLDVGGRLNKNGKLLYRLNLMALTKGAHRNYEFNNRYTIAPSLTYEFNDKTSVTAEYLHQYSQMSLVGAAYVFSPNKFADLPRDFTLAEPNIDPSNFHEHNIFISMNHRINPNWELTAKLSYLNYQQEGSSLWASDVKENGDLLRTLSSFDALNESKLGQVYLNGKVTTGAVGHQVLAGIDVGHKDYFADWWQSGSIGDDVFNVYQPVYGVPASTLPVFDRSQSIRKRATSGSYPAVIGQRYSSLYLQDQLQFFNNRARLTLAARYTSYNGWSYANTTNDEVLSPRLGLSITVAKNTSVYSLYDQSFIPQAGTTVEGAPFVPLRANNLEAGIKRDWANGRWNTTLAVYQITKENVVVAHWDQNVLDLNPNAQVQLGEVQSRGLEFDLQGEITKGLQLILNYANTNVEITEDTRENMIGTRVAGHARHMTNGWLHYQLQQSRLRGLGLSLGYQYQVDRSSWNWGSDNDSLLPDYFRLDGAVSWQNDDLSIGLNINNLLNEYLYSGSSYSSYYYWQTEPGRNFRLNVAYKF